MAIQLPALPFARDALVPHISEETLDYHYGKHHNTYVVKLNGLVAGTDLEQKSLEDLIKTEKGGIFNNAAQVWNHTFYWNCLSPKGGGAPAGTLAEAINAKWGSFSAFQEAFTNSAVNNFGSSWTWLVKKSDGTLDIMNTSNAGCPLTDSSVTAVMTVDLWEHAYYIDYRNARPDYMAAFWKLVNWEFAQKNFA